MARTTTIGRTSAKRAPEPAPKKRIGRPLGSKNKLTLAVKARASSSKAAKRPVARKAIPSAPKLNKAELEAHLVKLERTIVRLRKQNAELKQATPAPKPAPAPAPAPAKADAAGRKPKPAASKVRRPAKSATPKATPANDTGESSHPDD